MTTPGPAAPRAMVFPDLATLSDAVARAVVEAAHESLLHRGRFTIALSGGDTPRPAYELLGGRYAGDIDWSRTEIFFGDERCVPQDDARSNFRLARESFLSRLPVAPRALYPMYEAGEPPGVAAQRYEELLRSAFPAMSAADPPTFDLAFQGVGPDGHTASLFPGNPALGELERWVVPVRARPDVEIRDRISLTLPALNHARRVLFMVAGDAKRDAVSRVLRPRQADEPALPAALVSGLDDTCWMLDVAAAGDLAR